MTREVCENCRIVYFWLNKTERASQDIKTALAAEKTEWNNKGYKTCTFISGDGNLADLTKELLVHNRDVIARKSLETGDNLLAKADT